MKGEIISEPLASQRLKNMFASQFSPGDYKSSSTAQRQIFPHQNITLNSFYFVRQHFDNYTLAAPPNYKPKAVTSRGRSAKLQSFLNDLLFFSPLRRRDSWFTSIHFHPKITPRCRMQEEVSSVQ